MDREITKPDELVIAHETSPATDFEFELADLVNGYVQRQQEYGDKRSASKIAESVLQDLLLRIQDFQSRM